MTVIEAVQHAVVFLETLGYRDGDLEDAVQFLEILGREDRYSKVLRLPIDSFLADGESDVAANPGDKKPTNDTILLDWLLTHPDCGGYVTRSEVEEAMEIDEAGELARR